MITDAAAFQLLPFGAFALSGTNRNPR